MTDKIIFDSAEPPNIGVARPGTTSQEIEDYVRVAHNPVIALPPGDEQYRGVYWTPPTVSFTDELGTDLEGAMRQFRSFLRQPR